MIKIIGSDKKVGVFETPEHSKIGELFSFAKGREKEMTYAEWLKTFDIAEKDSV